MGWHWVGVAPGWGGTRLGWHQVGEMGGKTLCITLEKTGLAGLCAKRTEKISKSSTGRPILRVAVWNDQKVEGLGLLGL